MEAIVPTDPEACPQQDSPVLRLRLRLSNILRVMQVKKLRTARPGQTYGDSKPKAVTPGETSKSEGKTGDQPQQAEGGAKAPPKENPPADPKQGTSKDPTDVPVPMEVITQDPIPSHSPRPRGRSPIKSSQHMSKITSRQGKFG